MVAYSFQRRFVDPIKRGLVSAYSDGHGLFPKRQTIRADRKRHARVGEELQLYVGMRTKQCQIIGNATCVAVENIYLFFGVCPGVKKDSGNCDDALDLDAFARDDGFASWFDLFQFWREQHGDIAMFIGKLIRWERQ